MYFSKRNNAASLENTFTHIHLPPQRELSSAGSEHLPYKQRVTGSNPVAPTQ